VRAGLLQEADIPKRLLSILGRTSSQRINTMISDIVMSSEGKPGIFKSHEIGEATSELRQFMFERVYIGSKAKAEEQKAKGLIKSLYFRFAENPSDMPSEFAQRVEAEGAERIACDYTAGMTDTYAVKKYSELFVPHFWG
jgi:dGTPase